MRRTLTLGYFIRFSLAWRIWLYHMGFGASSIFSFHFFNMIQEAANLCCVRLRRATVCHLISFVRFETICVSMDLHLGDRARFCWISKQSLLLMHTSSPKYLMIDESVWKDCRRETKGEGLKIYVCVQTKQETILREGHYLPTPPCKAT